ncbi:sulfite exporter TauE/SafE family protein [Parvularcula sp. ZS-1/3]|uniref:Probable membrane transporter protein n=1 Tax=Parvularcula mediterranea TaxID=2732508 RepID=A0A7Y3RK09_9PROT|nr:sulfite exporter TauE/SafE family protein [Parvularcula mediterranea]NNU14802.1 sulfite exporter TauE/SafE family protein [Parvularcula mediterranea]
MELSLDLTAMLLTLMSGALVGVLLGTFGGGGSVLAAPLLLYVVGVGDTHLALGTSAAGVAAIALFGLLGHWRAGRVKWACALTFALAGMGGALIGASLAKATADDVLLLAFSGAMAAVALAMFRKPKSLGDPSVSMTKGRLARLLPVGGVVGGASGFFGIGGGFLIVPGLMAAAGMTLTHAAAASLVSVAAFGATTSASYAVSGLVDARLVVLMLAGGAMGGLLGMKLSAALEGRQQLGRRLFAGMILLVAAFIAVDAGTRVF